MFFTLRYVTLSQHYTFLRAILFGCLAQSELCNIFVIQGRRIFFSLQRRNSVRVKRKRVPHKGASVPTLDIQASARCCLYPASWKFRTAELRPGDKERQISFLCARCNLAGTQLTCTSVKASGPL